MADSKRFLRPNVIIEPLVDRFYAWCHTVAPVQASLNLAALQLPLLESFLQDPQVHVNAVANPRLRGGYFVNVAADRAGEIKDLVSEIKTERAAMLRFAAAVAEGEEIVRQGAAGFDLTPLYPQLPPELSGLVELAYDTNNQAQLRFIEPATYKSDAYTEARQSVQLSVETGIERPFILSTPRLPSQDVLELKIPFRHEALTRLLRSRVHGTTLAELRDELELGESEAARLDALLADAPDLAPDRHIESGGRLRYFGHACLVLQSPQATVVSDPFISGDSTAANRYTYRDLPDYIDAVLITHGHQDHIVLESLLQLRGRVGTVVVPRSSRGNLCDPSLGLYLRHVGMPVTEVDDFTEVQIPGGTVTATPFLGEHADLDIRAKSTYCVRLAGKNVFFGADSSGIDPGLYRYMRETVGAVDIAFLGMECKGAPLTWLYKALLTQPVTKRMSDSRTLSGSNAAQAAAIMRELGAAEAYVYAMGEESWLGHVMATSYNEDSYQLKQVDEFVAWCTRQQIPADHLYEQREWRW